MAALTTPPPSISRTAFWRRGVPRFKRRLPTTAWLAGAPREPGHGRGRRHRQLRRRLDPGPAGPWGQHRGGRPAGPTHPPPARQVGSDRRRGRRQRRAGRHGHRSGQATRRRRRRRPVRCGSVRFGVRSLLNEPGAVLLEQLSDATRAPVVAGMEGLDQGVGPGPHDQHLARGLRAGIPKGVGRATGHDHRFPPQASRPGRRRPEPAACPPAPTRPRPPRAQAAAPSSVAPRRRLPAPPTPPAPASHPPAPAPAYGAERLQRRVGACQEPPNRGCGLQHA
jgi:hypothetical protein